MENPGFGNRILQLAKKERERGIVLGTFFPLGLTDCIGFFYTAPSLAVLIEFCAIGELLIFVMAFF